MEDKDETLFFLRDCIRQWEFDLKTFIPIDKKTEISKILKRAKELIKQHKLLYQYEITIKTPMRITEGMMRTMVENLAHYLTGYEADINIVDSLVDDNRNLPKAPEMCFGCKWLRNNECWFEDNYHGRDFPIDCSGYEKEK